MNARLKQFLEMESLSPARFCEMMGIQRSGLSHLLSGRNNPSFEFIQKMLSTFPTINADWLLLGKGKPYKEFSTDSEPIREKQGVLFENEHFEQQNPTPEPPENTIFEEEHAPIGRKIDRIVIFYNDGTFEAR